MKRRINWAHLCALICAAISLICLLMIPALNEAANQTRAKKGYGGECLIWTFPAFAAVCLKEEKYGN